MLKRILGIVLAATLALSTTVVAFAAYDYGEEFSGILGAKYTVNNMELSVGSTTDIELARYTESGKLIGDVESSFTSRYKTTIGYPTGRSYATASIYRKSGKSYLRIETKESTSKIDRELTVALNTRELGGDRRYGSSEFNFTIIADINRANDSISSYDDEYDLDEGRRVSVQCDTNITKCRINIGPSTYADVKARKGDILTFHLQYDDEDDEVSYNAPDNAELTFYNFKTSPSFRQSTKVGLYADEGQKYVYSIGSNSRPTNIPATVREDYLTFNTTKLGYYVISGRKLSATNSSSGSSSSSSSSCEEEEEEETTDPSYGGNISLSTLKQAFAKVAAGSTAVLNIENNDTVSLADLKAAAASYPRRGLRIAHRSNGKVTYQYTFSAAQIATLKDSDGTLNLGMSATATSTLAVFNNYYKNTFLSLEHLNKGSFGANASYAVHIGGTSISRNNLKIYWYDRSRNYYELVKTTPTVDKNSYLNFTAPVGYDIVVSDGPLVKR